VLRSAWTRHGITPSARSYNTLIKGYAHANRLRDAFEVVMRMNEALGPAAANEVTYSTLIHACVQNGQLARARQLLSWLASNASAPLSPDVYCYTTVIRGLLMQPHGLVPQSGATSPGSTTSVTRAASASASPPWAYHMYACRVVEARRLFSEMLELGIQPNPVCVSTLVRGCLEIADDLTAAHATAESARTVGTSLGDPSLGLAADAALIGGYCRLPVRDRSRLRSALELFARYAARARGRPGTRAAPRPLLDVRTCNALVLALTEVGELPSARRVLMTMDTGATEAPNAFTLAILMRAYGVKGEMRGAREMWSRCVREGVVDTVALNAYLASCMACSEEGVAMQAFQQAKVDLPHVALDRVTFATLIDGLCNPRAKRSTSMGAKRALQLWAEMRTLGLAADAGIVSSLFVACERHCHVEVALRLRAELLSMGWPERSLHQYSSALLLRLPPMMDVLREPERWATLGVACPDIASEQSQLLLHAPSGRTAEVDAEEKGSGDPASQPATVSQEIFERKGWNDMDSSGWKPWVPW